MIIWFRYLVYLLALLLIQSLRLIFKLEFSGSHRIPRTGPVIILYNHQCNWDPVVLGWGAGRRLNYVAKKELFKFPPLGALIRACGAFPLDRKNPLTTKSSFQYIRSLLRRGEALAIAPEGTRNKRFRETGKLLPLKTGIVRFLLSLGAGDAETVPVFIPAAMVYLPGKGARTLVKVRYGEPFDTAAWFAGGGDRKVQAACCLKDIQNRMQRQIDELYSGV